FDTLIDQTIIENGIINPLLTNPNQESKIENIIANTSVETTTKVNTCIQEVNTGNSVLFIEDSKQAYTMSTAKYQARSIENPENEISLLGRSEERRVGKECRCQW